MLKTGHRELMDCIATDFRQILHGESDIPVSWRSSRLVVLYKKGDAKLAKNYRPIAIIPVLSKLFSGVLLARIKPILDALQSVEQTGFRPDYSCIDEVHFLHMVAEKADEWGEEVWAASLDLEKAFDKVFHQAVFDSLAASGVDADIVSALWRLYAEQTACVCIDGNVRSQCFEIL